MTRRWLWPALLFAGAVGIGAAVGSLQPSESRPDHSSASQAVAYTSFEMLAADSSAIVIGSMDATDTRQEAIGPARFDIRRLNISEVVAGNIAASTIDIRVVSTYYDGVFDRQEPTIGQHPTVLLFVRPFVLSDGAPTGQWVVTGSPTGIFAYDAGVATRVDAAARSLPTTVSIGALRALAVGDGSEVTLEPRPASTFGAITPARLYESRAGEPTTDGLQQGVGRSPANSVTELIVAGRASIPVDAAAVVLNVTAVFPEATGWIRAWPCGEPEPKTASVNYDANSTTGNSMVVKIGASGTVCLRTNWATDIVVDTTGYFTAGTFGAILPARLYESRAGEPTTDGLQQGVGRSPANSVTELIVAGRASIPVDAAAVVLNVTAVFPEATGWIRAWPCGEPEPTTASVNYNANSVTGNAMVVKIGAAGKVCLRTYWATDIVVDTTGYFAAGNFGAIVPARYLDTRLDETTFDGERGRPGPIQTVEHQLRVAGRGDVPVGASAVTIGIVAVASTPSSTGPGWVRAFPCGSQVDTSSVNFDLGEIRGNNAIVEIGLAGSICLQSSNRVDVVVDVTGYIE